MGKGNHARGANPVREKDGKILGSLPLAKMLRGEVLLLLLVLFLLGRIVPGKGRSVS